MSLNDFLDKVLKELNENIKFLEAKNAALITLNSALITWGGGKIFDDTFKNSYRAIASLLIILLIIPLIISINSFRPSSKTQKRYSLQFSHINPSSIKISIKPKKPMYYVYIHKYYHNAISYLDDLCLGRDASSIQYSAFDIFRAQQIIDLADVAYRKTVLFTLATKMEFIIFITGSVASTIILTTLV